MSGLNWQDGLTALAAVVALTWLVRRWLAKRRAKAGCDTCAAAMHARMRTPRT